MDKKLKKAWVKALRSGNYRQAKHGLINRQGDRVRYCCLGVLCRVAGGKFDNEGMARVPSKGLTSVAYLGSTLLKEFGFDMTAECHLADMNDTHSKSFKEIADWIEENL